MTKKYKVQKIGEGAITIVPAHAVTKADKAMARNKMRVAPKSFHNNGVGCEWPMCLHETLPKLWTPQEIEYARWHTKGFDNKRFLEQTVKTLCNTCVNKECNNRDYTFKTSQCCYYEGEKNGKQR